MTRKRTKATKAVLVVTLFLCFAMTTFGITWQGEINNYWDEPINWTGDVLPTSTDDAVIYGTSGAPVWIRPGTDAVCGQLWLAHNGNSSNLIIDGNFSWGEAGGGNFIFGYNRGNEMHNTVQVNAGGVCMGGSIFVGNDNWGSDHTITLDGGYFDAPAGISSIYTSELNFQINEGHLGLGAAGAVSDPNDQQLIININGPAADFVFPTDTLDNVLIGSGCLQAEGTTIAVANAGTLLDIYDDAQTGLSLVVLAGADIGKARAPVPADGGQSVFDADLTWLKPAEPNTVDWTYKVYFDTDNNVDDGTVVTVGPFADPRGTITNTQIGGPLVPGTIYYWRVDAIEPGTTHTGDLWTFTATVPLPTLVNPADGTGGYGLELLLRWDSDDDSVNSGLIQEHRVLLNNLTDGTDGVSYDKLASQEDYYLANPDMWDIVDYGKDYTWQVVELGAGDVVLGIGPLWSFSTLELGCTGLSAAADIDGSGDCKVTLADFAVIAAAWLECGSERPGEDPSIPYPDKDPCLW